MSLRKSTTLFSIALIIIAAIYDVYVLSAGGTETSISHMVVEWSHKYTILPLSFGVLCGHFFLRATNIYDAFDSVLMTWAYKFPIMPFAAGAFAGYFSTQMPVYASFFIGLYLGRIFWRIRDTEIFKDMGI